MARSSGDALLVGLREQLDALDLVQGGASDAALTRRPAPGKWSALDNLAHLGRHHEILLERIDRILGEDAPALQGYRSEADPGWPAWQALSREAVLARLAALRRRLIERAEALTPDELRRVGVHERFGALTLAQWLQFFLIHEAHHLYVALRLTRAAGG